MAGQEMPDSALRPTPPRPAPADTLRRAAATLRERAEAATPGPWEENFLGPATAGGRDWSVDRIGDDDDDPGDEIVDYILGPDAVFIATMHPGVALLFAELLDEIADAAHVIAPPNAAFTVAAAILGSPA